MTGMDGSANRSAWKQTKAGKKNTMGKWNCFQTILHKWAIAIGCIGILCCLCACSATDLEDIVTACAITSSLNEIFPGDPCKGDFALFGYGVTGGM